MSDQQEEAQLSTLLDRLKTDAARYAQRVRTGVAVHGFRSTFTDWAAEQTAFPTEIVELALAHKVGSKVEQAYRRTDQFQKRPAR